MKAGLARTWYCAVCRESPVPDSRLVRWCRRLQFDQVWFPIKHGDNSRYVHVGNLSDGCVTVLDLARWADIHEALISHRSPDGESLAQLVVKGVPERAR